VTVNSEYRPALVSVIMPTFNAARTIEESLASVLTQTHEALELLVIDDGSTDGTLEIVSRYAGDSRIRVLKTNGRIGSAKARNLGTNAAVGQFIAFCDSDDTWYPEKLREQLRFMMANDSALSGTAFERVDQYGCTLARRVAVPRRVCFADMLKRNSLCCASVVYDVSKVGKLFMPDYREIAGIPWYLRGFKRLPLHDDFLTWTEVLSRPQVQCAHGLDRVLVRYRVAPFSQSGNKIASALVRWHICRNVLRLGLVRSIWYFANYCFRSIAVRLTSG
jgi:teichuronic acid biosynthesis glycosyltransferase TuaG